MCLYICAEDINLNLNQLSVAVWPVSVVLWCKGGGRNGLVEKLFQLKLQMAFVVLFGDEAF